MQLRISSRTLYNYSSPVRFSPHLVRLFPRPDLDLKILSSKFSTAPEALVYRQRDQFDNQIARCVYQTDSPLLEFQLELEIETRERSAFDFLVDLHAVQFPFSYHDAERLALQPYLTQSNSEKTAARDLWSPDQPRSTVEALIELNQAVYSNFRYEYREEGEAYTPAETVSLRTGSCRDFSRLAASLLRDAGIAVRLVSGYAAELNVPVAERRAEGSLHAWIEAYIPGAGWLGMDPTNGTFADHNLIPTAVGLSPVDISPTLGTFSGGATFQLTTSLVLEPIE